MEKFEVTGQCLCKNVSVSAKIESKSFDACHCGMCRKWGGGPVMTVHAGNGIEISGKDFISFYNSSEWAERAFCKNCGSHLFYHLKGTDNYYIPVGLLDKTEDFKFTMQIFIDKKPEGYSFADDTKKMTEEEFFTKFGG